MSFAELLSYGFIQRALIAGIFVAILCSTLGVVLVLRRLSLIGDGLAHATFGSAALALLLKQNPLVVSLPVVALCSLGILKLTERAKLYGDAAIGIVSAFGIASGVLMASVAGGFNVDLFSFLFGNILSISSGEVVMSALLAIVVIAVFWRYYPDILSATFDPEFAKASGVRTGRINVLIGLLSSVTVVLAMKVVGIMLTSALLIIPAATALQVARSFRGALIIAASSGVLSVVIGIVASVALNLPTGAMMVLVSLLVFIMAMTARATTGRYST